MSTDTPDRLVLSGPTMGTRWSVVFHSHNIDPELTTELQTTAEEVDQSMSTWKRNSELMRLNRTAVGAWVPVSQDLYRLVELSLEIGEATSGAFDITVGAAVNAWGFGSAGVEAECPPAICSRSAGVEIDTAGSKLRRLADVQLDLSGIAKGHGVDRLAAVMSENGIADFIVSIDGEVRACGKRPGGEGWTVGLERPDRDGRALARTIAVSDVAVATSGDYRHFRLVEGRYVSHTIDPRSGVPLESDLCAVTVTAERCAVADAWATALLVLGEEEGSALADLHGLDALFTVRRDGLLHEIGVGAFGPAA